MGQHYSNKARELGPHSLPNVEVWEDTLVELRTDCGVFIVGSQSENARGFCPSCNRATCVHDLTLNADETGMLRLDKKGWFWWSCFLGCLPDSDPHGPFATEAEAVADAQDDNADTMNDVIDNEEDGN